MSSSRVYLEQLGATIGDVFTPMNPSSITASVQTEASVEVEAPTPTNESTGWYYVTLDDTLYTTGTIYKVIWSVVMVSGFPSSTLTTRFYYNATATNTYVYVQNAWLKLRSSYKLYDKSKYYVKNRTDSYRLYEQRKYYLINRSLKYKLFVEA